MAASASTTQYSDVPNNNDDDQISPIDRNWNNNQPDTTAASSIGPVNNTISLLQSEPFTTYSNVTKQDHQRNICDNNDRGGLILFIIHILAVLVISIYYLSSMMRLRNDDIFLQQYDESYVIEYWDNILPYYESWYLAVILLVPFLIVVSVAFLQDRRTRKAFLRATSILDRILSCGTILFSVLWQIQYMILWIIPGRNFQRFWDRIEFVSTMTDIATDIVQSQKLKVLAFYSYFYLSLFYLWLFLFWKTMVAAYFVQNSNPDYIDHIVGYIFIFFCISSLWMLRVLRDVTHVTTAALVGSLCQSRLSPSQSTARSLVSSFTQIHALHQRSLNKSIGSICTGFPTDVIECMKVSYRCRQGDIIFSHWVFIFVGIDCSNYKDSEKNARTLFQTNGWNLFTMDYLYKVDLFMIGTIIGYVALFYIIIMKFVLDPPTSDDYMVLVALVPLIFGYTMSMTVFTIIETIAQTVIICFYRSPHQFQTNYPQHYERMIEILPRRGAILVPINNNINSN